MQDVAFTVVIFVRPQHLVYIVALTLSVGVAVVPPSEVFATHENDHRFVVEGHITDSNGNGIPNARVFVRSEVLETGVTAFTDNSGFYSSLLHLHNADAGKAITVTALGTTKDLTADFDPADTTTTRGATVDIVHAVPAVPNASGGSDNSVYVTWGLVVLAAGVSFGVLSRKWARRRKAKSS